MSCGISRNLGSWVYLVMTMTPHLTTHYDWLKVIGWSRSLRFSLWINHWLGDEFTWRLARAENESCVGIHSCSHPIIMMSSFLRLVNSGNKTQGWVIITGLKHGTFTIVIQLLIVIRKVWFLVVKWVMVSGSWQTSRGEIFITYFHDIGLEWDLWRWKANWMTNILF